MPGCARANHSITRPNRVAAFSKRTIRAVASTRIKPPLRLRDLAAEAFISRLNEAN